VARLIEPTATFAESHKSFIREVISRGEGAVPWVLAMAGENFAEYVAWLESSAQGIGLEQGFVANSTFWLVDDRDEIVGVSNLRHELNDALDKFGGHIGFGVRPSERGKGYGRELLRRTLEQASRMGIERVKLICDRDNVRAAAVIGACGGRLEEEEFMEEHGTTIRRYWIEA
jgi:predicted acetyltransferase